MAYLELSSGGHWNIYSRNNALVANVFDTEKAMRIFKEQQDIEQNKQKGSVSMETNTERHKQVCYELNRIYDKKNRDYGDSFAKSFKDYGLVMAAIRIGDKYNRLHNLTARGADVSHVADESIRDTLLDLANYAIMTIMEIDAEEPKWQKENG